MFRKLIGKRLLARFPNVRFASLGDNGRKKLAEPLQACHSQGLVGIKWSLRPEVTSGVEPTYVEKRKNRGTKMGDNGVDPLPVAQDDCGTDSSNGAWLGDPFTPKGQNQGEGRDFKWNQ